MKPNSYGWTPKETNKSSYEDFKQFILHWNGIQTIL